jgi:hypothetical protein
MTSAGLVADTNWNVFYFHIDLGDVSSQPKYDRERRLDGFLQFQGVRHASHSVIVPTDFLDRIAMPKFASTTSPRKSNACRIQGTKAFRNLEGFCEAFQCVGGEWSKKSS